MAFRIGQEVCCVDDDKVSHVIQKGKTYFIADISDSYILPWSTRVFKLGANHLWLVGIPDGRMADNIWCVGCFAMWRFRPIQKTSISIFTAMLTKPPKKVEEHVNT